MQCADQRSCQKSRRSGSPKGNVSGAESTAHSKRGRDVVPPHTRATTNCPPAHKCTLLTKKVLCQSHQKLMSTLNRSARCWKNTTPNPRTVRNRLQVARASNEASNKWTDMEVWDKGNSQLVSHVRYIRSHTKSTLCAKSTLKHQVLTRTKARLLQLKYRQCVLKKSLNQVFSRGCCRVWTQPPCICSHSMSLFAKTGSGMTL
jgi:hypothetical protein